MVFARVLGANVLRTRTWFVVRLEPKAESCREEVVVDEGEVVVVDVVVVRGGWVVVLGVVGMDVDIVVVGVVGAAVVMEAVGGKRDCVVLVEAAGVVGAAVIKAGLTTLRLNTVLSIIGRGVRVVVLLRLLKKRIKVSRSTSLGLILLRSIKPLKTLNPLLLLSLSGLIMALSCLLLSSLTGKGVVVVEGVRVPAPLDSTLSARYKAKRPSTPALPA